MQKKKNKQKKQCAHMNITGVGGLKKAKKKVIVGGQNGRQVNM